jgi:hypothetical protein
LKTKINNNISLRDFAYKLRNKISPRCYNILKVLHQQHETVDDFIKYIDNNEPDDLIDSCFGMGIDSKMSLGPAMTNEIFMHLGKNPPYKPITKIKTISKYVLNRDNSPHMKTNKPVQAKLLKDLARRGDVSTRCYHLLRELDHKYETVENLVKYIDENRLTDILYEKFRCRNAGPKTINELFKLIGKNAPYKEVIKVQKTTTYVLNRDYDIR